MASDKQPSARKAKSTAVAARAAEALRQISTPRPGLYLQVSETANHRKVARDQSAAYVLTRLDDTLSTPGVSKRRILGNGGRNVYVYSVDPKDPTRLVRQDAKGHSTHGKVVNGSFRSTASKR